MALMDFIASRLTYREAGGFPPLVLDYIDGAESIKPFYAHFPGIAGIKASIGQRKQFPTHRQTLVDVLTHQYKEVSTSKLVQKNIEALAGENTFCITTAHQNNLFTGPLYVIYKIMHVVRLSIHLAEALPAHKFVPVFFMGSEDADLEELNHIHLGGEKITWNTGQRGAVGRMKVDAPLRGLLDRLQGQLGIHPFGDEWVNLLRESFQPGRTIQEATFFLLDSLFNRFGLLVLIADDPRLKRIAIPVFENDLFEHSASRLVTETARQLEKLGYPPQAHARGINMFYLAEGLRERIERAGEEWRVLNTDIVFSAASLRAELQEHPERFSPNVVFRGLYQEMILPGICFVGGAGELSYWLQLKSLFEHFDVPFPVLTLRNSHTIVEKTTQAKMKKLGLSPGDFFAPENEILRRYMEKQAALQPGLNGTERELQELYESIRERAATVDPTLDAHVKALQKKAQAGITALEKKMERAGRRKFEEQRRQIAAIRTSLFPGNTLGERVENLGYYYARWGTEFLDRLLEFAGAFEQEFSVLAEKD